METGKPRTKKNVRYHRALTLKHAFFLIQNSNSTAEDTELSLEKPNILIKNKSKNRKPNAHRGARTHDHKVKSLALYLMFNIGCKGIHKASARTTLTASAFLSEFQRG